MVKMMVDLSAMRWVACKDGREPISRNFSAFVGLTKFLGLRLEVSWTCREGRPISRNFSGVRRFDEIIS